MVMASWRNPMAGQITRMLLLKSIIFWGKHQKMVHHLFQVADFSKIITAIFLNIII
jgi:hypothetical protein